jgi:D-alanyl-lipoteichoic acid acyltransferase DltB (MBOAT superfamily)
MLFNSIDFFLFLPLAFFLHWFIFKNNKSNQNILLTLISYIFYGWWDYRFLILIFLSTVVDFFIGIKISKTKKTPNKKLFLFVSIFFNIGILFFFKYFNFFLDSWINLLSSLGYSLTSTWTLKVILPVGISFYTFQTMSYSIDVYKEKIIPTKDFFLFSTFVSFFPQLVAGPIERARNIIPQLSKKRIFDKKLADQGAKLILWGLFKKVVIADSLGPVVDNIFSGSDSFGGFTLMLGAVYFATQIYCDFSGYSDIAIGTAKLFGINLMSNFRFPYFSRDIGEFWRKWHISLSTWFRDYLYIPLGGSRVGTISAIRNIFIIFIISGLWHGANWTFVFWGVFHAALFLPLFISKNNRKNIDNYNKIIPSFGDFLNMSITFILTSFGWIFFRSESIIASFSYISNLFKNLNYEIFYDSYLALYVLPFYLIEWLFLKTDERKILFFKNTLLNTLSYGLIFLFIFIHFLENNYNNFIYFQF